MFLPSQSWDIVSYLKIYVLLYADDTILLAESPEELQAALYSMNLYCNDWNLKINVSKTKVVIFSRGKIIKLWQHVTSHTAIKKEKIIYLVLW